MQECADRMQGQGKIAALGDRYLRVGHKKEESSIDGWVVKAINAGGDDLVGWCAKKTYTCRTHVLPADHLFNSACVPQSLPSSSLEWETLGT